MYFGHAVAVKFPLSRYVPTENVSAVNTSSFKPDAALYRNRYGVLPSGVKGWPQDQIQHGQSTFWLNDLFRDTSFLAEHTEFTGVVVSEPPSTQDMTDLQFAASATLGGAYAYYQDQADQRGLLGSKTATGPASSPGAPGVPGVPSTGHSITAPTTIVPPELGGVITTTSTAPPSSLSHPGLSDVDRAELIAILERSFPGTSARILEGINLAINAKGMPLTQAITEALKVLDIPVDPKVLAALQIITLFT